MSGITVAEALDGVERLASIVRAGHLPDGTVRCWWCGIEPELVEITSLQSAEPEYVVGKWPMPGGDHQHAERPPTPGQLEQAGHEALMRIQREGWILD
jgi:hypothetical protein